MTSAVSVNSAVESQHNNQTPAQVQDKKI